MFFLFVRFKSNQHRKDTAQASLKKKVENNGVFIPSILNRNKPFFFTINNVDLADDMPDGKKLLYETGTLVVQEIVVDQQ